MEKTSSPHKVYDFENIVRSSLDKAKYSPVVQNSFFLMANTLISSFLGFLFWMVAARMYSHQEMGIGAALINGITLISLLADLGYGVSLIRFLPEFETQRNLFIVSSSVLVSVATILISLLFAIGIPLWASELAKDSHLAIYIVAFLVSTFIFSLAQYLDKIFIAQQKSYYFLIRNFFAGLLRIVVLLFYKSSLGALDFLIAIGVSSFITLVISIWGLIPKVVPEFNLCTPISLNILKNKFLYTISNHFSQIIWNIPPLIFPFIVVALLGSEKNAFFYIDWMIANVIFMVPLAVSTSSFANTTYRKVGGDRLYWKSMVFTLLGLCPVVVPMTLFSSHILRLYGGESYVASKDLLIWLLLSAFPYALNIFAITFMRIKSNLLEMVIISAAITTFSLLGVALLGNFIGLTGLGIGWFAAQGVGSVIIAVCLSGQNKKRYSSKPLPVSNIG